MRVSRLLLIAFCLQSRVGGSHAAPGRATSQVLLGEVDIAVQQQDDGSSEITTEEPFLKKCIVDGNAYSHSQTIPSYDVNSHCLCVAGEVYCWWQNYNSSGEASVGAGGVSSGDGGGGASSSPPTTVGSNYSPLLEASTDVADSYEASGDPAEEQSSIEQQQQQQQQQQGSSEINGTYGTTVPPPPATCLVMGREYREGEVLPHSTGNCVECSCGSEGRVECSPRDCVALRPEIPVAPDIPEAPDGDFEVFNLARERGLDDGF